jgi:hypothetical protein
MRDKNNPGLYEQDDLSPQDLLDIQHPMIKLDDGRKVVSMKSATGLSSEAISDGLLVRSNGSRITRKDRRYSASRIPLAGVDVFLRA